MPEWCQNAPRHLAHIIGTELANAIIVPNALMMRKWDTRHMFSVSFRRQCRVRHWNCRCKSRANANLTQWHNSCKCIKHANRTWSSGWTACTQHMMSTLNRHWLTTCWGLEAPPPGPAIGRGPEWVRLFDTLSMLSLVWALTTTFGKILKFSLRGVFGHFM